MTTLEAEPGLLAQINAPFASLTIPERRERMRWDTPALAANALVIVNKRGERQMLMPKPEQLRMDAALEQQRQDGLPMRLIDLKARQLGGSTWAQAKNIQRTTQLSDHHALTLAQEHGTAGELFEIGRRMWEFLPDEHGIKPKLTGRRKNRVLEFDNGSWYRADSAKEFESGRGLTIHSLHISEVAFYPDAQRKLTGLLQAVPNEPGTMIILESTANGQNYFKDLWDAAEAGESDYIPFFSPWYREPSYARRFANDAEREDFQAVLGDGIIGEDEIDLISLLESEDFLYDEILEKLHWRRWVIRNNFAGDIDRFHQEFPSTPLEAFMTTGRHVFNVGDVRRMQMRVREVPEPQTGRLEVKGPTQPRQSRGVTVHIPQAVEWVPGPVNDDRNPGWKIWEHPQPKTEDTPAGQYVIGGDASGGDEIEGTAAYHVLSVLDHRTRAQVAEYRSRIDPDELALEAYKACLYFNRPWIAIEVTGSWGGPAMRRLHHDFRYAFVYRRPQPDSAKIKEVDRLGWHTGFAEKKLLITELKEMLRDEDPGIRSRGLADEFGWYIMDDRNRQKPEFGKTSDRLIARGIAVCVAREKPLRPDRKPGHTRSTIEGLTLSRAGYTA